MQKLENYYAGITEILRNSADRRCGNFFMIPKIIGEKRYCALGTIGHHFGVPDRDIFVGFKKHRNTILQQLGLPQEYKNKHMKCPRCGARALYFGLIAHLNDQHDLKWGKIADDLERTQEYPKDASKLHIWLDSFKMIPFWPECWEIYNSIRNKIH